MKGICPKHGVWNKTPEAKSCPECKRTKDRNYDTTKRNKETAKFYNSKEWKSVRLIAIKRDGAICQQCLREDRVTVFDVVDHIIEIEDGGSKLNPDNLECLCHTCHNQKTAAKAKERA